MLVRLLMVLCATGLVAATSSRAETYSCHFTEPFITVEFDTETEQITVVDANEMSEDEKTGERLEVRRLSQGKLKKLGENRWEIANEKRSVVVELILDHKGSDGMSDKEFPFTAKFRGHTGGAYSTSHPAKGGEG